MSAQNGYKNGVNATVTATQEPQPSRIRVTVQTTITNFFAGLVGYNTQTITRDAVADFQGPVPMGSPTSKLGQDPDDCDPATSGSCANFWLNTSGPKGTKREGDRFATEVCNDGTVAGCAGTVNSEYKSKGYLFRIRVNSIQAGQPLVLQVYDPAWMYTEDFCNNVNMPTNLQQNNIPALTGAPWNITNVVPAGAGNISRYGTSNGGQSINVGGTRWCTGDQNAGGGGGNIQNTTYIVRKPDLTPWDDTDNVVAECPAAYFRGINQPMQTLLDPTNVSNDALYVKNYFHRWATVCTIPAANVALGDYVIQVKTNANPSGLERGRRHVPDVGRGSESGHPHEQRRRLQPLLDAGGVRHELGPERQRPRRHGRVAVRDEEPSDLRQRRLRHDAAVLPRPHHAHGGVRAHPEPQLLRHRRRRQRIGQRGDPRAPRLQLQRRLPRVHLPPGQRADRGHRLRLHHPDDDDRGLQRAFDDDDDPDPRELQLRLRASNTAAGSESA